MEWELGMFLSVCFVWWPELFVRGQGGWPGSEFIDNIILGEIFLNLTILMFLKIKVEYECEKKKIFVSTEAVQEFHLNKLKPTKPKQSD